jgi:dihydroorotase
MSATPRLFSVDRPPATLLLRGGRLLDPRTAPDGPVLSIAVRDGVIVELGSAPELDGAEVIDAAGLTILPAFVDPHVHLRVPGQEYKEDIASGTRAAARGGYGAILAMPNTRPTIDSASVFDAVAEIAAAEAEIPTGIVAAVSVGLAGEQLTEMGELADHGAAGFTDDGRPVRSAALLRRALAYARPLGLPVALHEEDPALSADGHMHEGSVSARLGIGGWPSIAESAMVARDLEIAAFEDGRLHLQHLSARGSVEAVERARAGGLRVTSEATPHHLILTDEACAELDPATTKMNPPLGSDDDRQALLDAVRRGSVDMIATDHAPHAAYEKEVPFEAAPFGVTGLETAFPALYTKLVLPGLLELGTVVERMTAGPAAAFALPVPSLAVDAPASFSVWDLDAEEEVTAAGFASKSANNAFLGERLRGVCVLTVAAGRVVHRDEARLAHRTRTAPVAGGAR